MLEALAGTAISGGLRLWGANQDRKAQEAMAERNIALQREFAQNGVSWKVEDAKRAGIHPLFALGASTTSFSPVSVGSSNMGEHMGSIGQDISRAIQSGSSAKDRTDQFSRSLQALQLRRAGLENELLSSQIAKLRSSTPPPIPNAATRWLLDGQGQAPSSSPSPSGVPGTLIKQEPLETGHTEPGKPYMEPGALPDMGYARTATGYAPHPGKHVKERIEDSPMEWMWFWRNQILPTLGWNQQPPNIPLPPGEEWGYHPTGQEYRRRRRVPFGPTWRYQWLD